MKIFMEGVQGGDTGDRQDGKRTQSWRCSGSGDIGEGAAKTGKNAGADTAKAQARSPKHGKSGEENLLEQLSWCFHIRSVAV